MFSFFKRSSKKESVENGTGASASIQKDGKRGKKDLAKGVPLRARSRAATDENSAWKASSNGGDEVSVPVMDSGPAGNARAGSESVEGGNSSSSSGGGSSIMARPVAALRGKGKVKRKVAPNSNGNSMNSNEEQQPAAASVSQQGQSVPRNVQPLNNQPAKNPIADSKGKQIIDDLTNQQANSAAISSKSQQQQAVPSKDVLQKPTSEQGKSVSLPKETLTQFNASKPKEPQVQQVQLVKQEQNISTAKIKRIPEQSTQAFKPLASNVSTTKENLTQKTPLQQQGLKQEKQNTTRPDKQQIPSQQEPNASKVKQSEQQLNPVNQLKRIVSTSKEDLTASPKTPTAPVVKPLTIHQPQFLVKQPQQSPPGQHHGPPSFKPKPLQQLEKSFVEESQTEAKHVQEKVLKAQPSPPCDSPTTKQSPLFRRTVHFAEHIEEIQTKSTTPPISASPKQPVFLQRHDSKSNLVNASTIEIEFPDSTSAASPDEQQPLSGTSIPRKPTIPQRISSIKKDEQVIPLVHPTREQTNTPQQPQQQIQTNEKDNQNSPVKLKPQISAKPQLQPSQEQLKTNPNVLPTKPAFLQTKPQQPLQILIEPNQPNVVPWRKLLPKLEPHELKDTESNQKQLETQNKVQIENTNQQQKVQESKVKLVQKSEIGDTTPKRDITPLSSPLFYRKQFEQNKEQKPTQIQQKEQILNPGNEQPKQTVIKQKLQVQTSQEKQIAEQPVQKISKPPYTNILRNLEQHESEMKKSALNVKPCSHVTIAASPRTPPLRTETSTPPGSPVASSKTKHTKTDEPVTKDDADTISAAMKLRIDLQSVPKKTHSNSEQANTLKVKQSSDTTNKNSKLTNEKISNKTPDVKTVEVKNKDSVADNKNKTANQINELKKLDDKVTPIKNTKEVDNNNKTKNLVNQETRFQTQLTELNDRLKTKEEETNKLRFQMEDLQRDLYVKSSGVDRLQAELLAAHKDSECVRNKLKLLQNEVVTYKQKNAELIEEVQKKTEEYKQLEAKSKERTAQLESSVSELTAKLTGLETQIENIKQERNRLEKERANLEAEREEEKKIVQEALEAAMEEKEEIKKRWEDDFEKLRTVNTDREQQMLDDFEWKLREVQQMCKKRLDEKEKQAELKIKEVQKDVDAKLKHAQEQLNEVARLKSYEAEVTQLRGLTNDQQRSLRVMSVRADELQLAEQNLNDEISRLHGVIQDERNNKADLKRKHEKDLADHERTLQIRMDKQKGEIAVVWEQKLRQECGRLKSELDQMHSEEKSLAIELLKFQKEQAYEKLKDELEQKVKDCMNEISNLKNTIYKKDEKHQTEIDRIRTNSDRDIMELRRELDKAEMAYHERIEKILEEHEQELEKVNEETERRIKEMEQNCQIQVSSMRATLELVKEQMERESQDRIQQITEEHQKVLDKQWERLTEEKNKEIDRLEKDYKTKFDRLREQFSVVQKNHQSKELELTKLIENLKGDMNNKVTVIEDLQSNVDTLHGGVQVLNEEIANQDQKFEKMKVDSDQKIGELQHALKVERETLQVEREEHIEEITHLQKQSQTVIEQLQRKCQCLTKLFEEMRSRYDRRDSRPEDIKLISDLRSVIAEQEKDLAILNEEKRYFQLELMKKHENEKNPQTEVPKAEGSNTAQEQTFKGGGSCGKLPDNNDKQCVLQVRSQSVDINVQKSENLDLPTSLSG